jgi:hypothetical protein
MLGKLSITLMIIALFQTPIIPVGDALTTWPGPIRVIEPGQ